MLEIPKIKLIKWIQKGKFRRPEILKILISRTVPKN